MLQCAVTLELLFHASWCNTGWRTQYRKRHNEERHEKNWKTWLWKKQNATKSQTIWQGFGECINLCFLESVACVFCLFFSFFFNKKGIAMSFPSEFINYPQRNRSYHSRIFQIIDLDLKTRSSLSRGFSGFWIHMESSCDVGYVKACIQYFGFCIQVSRNVTKTCIFLNTEDLNQLQTFLIDMSPSRRPGEQKKLSKVLNFQQPYFTAIVRVLCSYFICFGKCVRCISTQWAQSPLQ